MSEGGYKIRTQAAIHFITFAVVSQGIIYIQENVVYWM